MKVLFITPHFLDDNGGGSFASRAYLNAFSELAESFMLLYPDRGNSIDKYIHKSCIKIGVPDNRSNLKKGLDVYKGVIHRFGNIAIPKIVSFDPDVVVFDNSNCSAGLIEIVKGKMNKKVITIHHNYMVEFYRDTRPYSGWKSIFLNQVFMHYMVKAEKKAVLLSDLNITLTDQDANLLYSHYDPKKNRTIAKLGCFESEKTKETQENTIHLKKDNELCFIITGNLSAYQTEISIIPFLKNLYPELLKKLPKSKLIIAGRNPSEKITSICSNFPSIIVIANPQDMQEIIKQGDIYICPTSAGGGLKLRVMDGLKAGLPVLTHVVSARGYEEFKKMNCLFDYDDKSTFLASLEQLIKKFDRKQFDKENIKNIYKSIFSYEAGVTRLKELVSKI